MKTAITVVAQIQVKPGMEERFKQEFQEAIALTRTETGCINYDLHQCVDDPCLFLLHENWTSQEMLERHLQMPHIKALSALAAEILAAPPQVRRWRLVVGGEQ